MPEMKALHGPRPEGNAMPIECLPGEPPAIPPERTPPIERPEPDRMPDEDRIPNPGENDKPARWRRGSH